MFKNINRIIEMSTRYDGNSGELVIQDSDCCVVNVLIFAPE